VLGERSGWIDAVVPQGDSGGDLARSVIILLPRLWGRSGSSLGPPRGIAAVDAKAPDHAITTQLKIVAGKRMNDKAERRSRRELQSQAAVPRAMVRARTQHLCTGDDAEAVGELGKGQDHRVPFPPRAGA
jgi:hypothetical protein